MRKEQLLKELKAIEEAERQKMISENYEEFKKLEGKCFKFRNNYSCPEKKSDYWWMYKQVIAIPEDGIYQTSTGVSCHLKCWTFQTDKYGASTINPDDTTYAHSLGEEITKEEFDAAFEKMIKAILNLNK